MRATAAALALSSCSHSRMDVLSASRVRRLYRIYVQKFWSWKRGSRRASRATKNTCRESVGLRAAVWPLMKRWIKSLRAWLRLIHPNALTWSASKSLKSLLLLLEGSRRGSQGKERLKRLLQHSKKRIIF